MSLEETREAKEGAIQCLMTDRFGLGRYKQLPEQKIMEMIAAGYDAAAAHYSAALETERAERRKLEEFVRSLTDFRTGVMPNGRRYRGGVWGDKGQSSIYETRIGGKDRFDGDDMLQAITQYLNSLDHQNAAEEKNA